MKSILSRLSITPKSSLLIGIAAVSTASLFIRYAQGDAPSLVIAAFRISGASFLLLITNWKSTKKHYKTLSTKDNYTVLMAGLFLALHFASWITSLEYTSITSSVVLVTTTPLWVALFSPLLLKEKVSPTTIIGLIIAFGGTLIIGISDTCSITSTVTCPPISSILGGGSFLGNALAIVGALSAAGFTLLGRKVRVKMAFFPYITVLYTVASIILWVFVAFAGLSPFGYLPQTYFWMLLLAIIPQLIGHSSFNWALGHLPASFVSIALLGEPIGTIILAFFFLKEVPSNISLFGAAVILIGILIPTILGKTKNTKDKI